MVPRVPTTLRGGGNYLVADRGLRRGRDDDGFPLSLEWGSLATELSLNRHIPTVGDNNWANWHKTLPTYPCAYSIRQSSRSQLSPGLSSAGVRVLMTPRAGSSPGGRGSSTAISMPSNEMNGKGREGIHPRRRRLFETIMHLAWTNLHALRIGA